MNDFLFQIPTRLYFGKGEEPMVGKRIREYGGSRVLLHYGGGSIQKTGLYDNVLRYLKDEMCIRDRSILARRRFFLSIARDTPQAAITEAMLVKSHDVYKRQYQDHRHLADGLACVHAESGLY